MRGWAEDGSRLADHRLSGGAAPGPVCRSGDAGRLRRPHRLDGQRLVARGQGRACQRHRSDRHGHAHRFQFRIGGGQCWCASRSPSTCRRTTRSSMPGAARRRRSTSSSSSSIAARRTCGGIASPKSCRRATGRRCASRNRASHSPGDRSVAARRRTSLSSSLPSRERKATADRCGSTSCASRSVRRRRARRAHQRSPPPRASKGTNRVRCSTTIRSPSGRAAHWPRSSGCSSTSTSRASTAAWSSTGARTTTRSRTTSRCPTTDRTGPSRTAARTATDVATTSFCPTASRATCAWRCTRAAAARATQFPRCASFRSSSPPPQSIHRGHRQRSSARYISALLLAPADVLDRGRHERR